MGLDPDYVRGLSRFFEREIPKVRGRKCDCGAPAVTSCAECSRLLCMGHFSAPGDWDKQGICDIEQGWGCMAEAAAEVRQQIAEWEREEREKHK